MTQQQTGVYLFGFTLLETFLVFFIKAESVEGQLAYNAFTVNAIAEFIKLCIAIKGSYDEGSIHNIQSMFHQKPFLLLRFFIPNLLYAINNNLFHYSIATLPILEFLFVKNIFQTLLTFLFHPYVSKQKLLGWQVVACILHFFSLIMASLTDIIKVAFSGTIVLSAVEQMIFLSAIYSVISVSASLAQENLMKEPCNSLMVVNTLNYSSGFAFQLMFLAGHHLMAPEESATIIRGFKSNFAILLLSCTMALAGTSVGFILKYYNNISKLIFSGVSLLLVNSITSYMTGDATINTLHVFGWLMSLLAAYLYHVNLSQPPQAVDYDMRMNTSVDLDDDAPLLNAEDNVQLVVKNSNDNDCETSSQINHHKEPQIPKQKSNNRKVKIGFLFFLISLLLFSVLTSKFEMNSLDKSIDDDENVYQTCSIFEVPYSDSRNNIRTVASYDIKYSNQYVFMDDFNGNAYISCSSGKVYLLGPDTVLAKSKVGFDQVCSCTAC